MTTHTKLTGPVPDEVLAYAEREGACDDGLDRARLGWEHATLGDRRWLAGRKTCPVDLLRSLGADSDWYVREAVASNTQCPVDLLRSLSTDSFGYVRWAVAWHPSWDAGIGEQPQAEEAGLA